MVVVGVATVAKTGLGRHQLLTHLASDVWLWCLCLFPSFVYDEKNALDLIPTRRSVGL